MNTLFYVLLAVMLAIVVVLLAGIVIMMKGGERNKKLSGRLMTVRVALQAVAVAILGILFLMKP